MNNDPQNRINRSVRAQTCRLDEVCWSNGDVEGRWGIRRCPASGRAGSRVHGCLLTMSLQVPVTPRAPSTQGVTDFHHFPRTADMLEHMERRGPTSASVQTLICAYAIGRLALHFNDHRIAANRRAV